MAIKRVLTLTALFTCLAHIGGPTAARARAPRDAKIVFTSAPGPAAEIYVMNPDGGDLQQLTRLDAASVAARWSPDGRRIVFSSTTRGAAGLLSLYVMKADGSDITRLTDARFASDCWPTWSPDGRTIAFASTWRPGAIGCHIYVVDAGGGNERRLTPDVPFNGTTCSAPSWSPDGSRIAFASWNLDGSHIFTVGADGTGVRQLTAEGSNWSPSWSPDGTRIVFASSPHLIDPNTDICVMDPDGRNVVRLTDGPGRNRSPAWSPDGSMIVFDRFLQMGVGDIHIMDRDGRNERRLTDSRDMNHTADWFDPAALTVSPVGKRPDAWGWLKHLGASVR